MAKFKINEGNVENFFCCTTIFDRICEGVVDEHMLGFVLSGELTLQTKEKKVNIRNGEAVFIRRNHLVTKLKQPAKNGQPFLRCLFIRRIGELLLRPPRLKHLQSIQPSIGYF